MKKHTFEQWQILVNLEIVKRTGLGIDDLPDFDYWNYWHDGVSPVETAEEVIENARNY
jgi:hypothetical protein